MTQEVFSLRDSFEVFPYCSEQWPCSYHSNDEADSHNRGDVSLVVVCFIYFGALVELLHNDLQSAVQNKRNIDNSRFHGVHTVASTTTASPIVPTQVTGHRSQHHNFWWFINLYVFTDSFVISPVHDSKIHGTYLSPVLPLPLPLNQTWSRT